MYRIPHCAQVFLTHRPRLAELPDIIVATPGRLIEHLKARVTSQSLLLVQISFQNLVISKSLEMVVIDEADLVMDYGYKEDMEVIKTYLPRICQGFLMSATLSDEGMFPFYRL